MLDTYGTAPRARAAASTLLAISLLVFTTAFASPPTFNCQHAMACLSREPPKASAALSAARPRPRARYWLPLLSARRR